MLDFVVLSLLCFIIGGVGGYFYSQKRYISKQKKYLTDDLLFLEKKNKSIEIDIEKSEKKIVKLELFIQQKEDELEKKIIKTEKSCEQKEDQSAKKIEKLEVLSRDILDKKELELNKEIDRYENREKSLDIKFKDLEGQKEKLKLSKLDLDEEKVKLQDLIDSEESKLEQIANLTEQEARKQLLEKIEVKYEDDLLNKIHRVKEKLKIEVDNKAREVIIESIQKLSSDVTSESTVTQVELENDDLKGRIIGREGRNINSFEKILGVNLIIDDVPNVVILSSFDPLRRFIAGEVLKELLQDGRIHPARIESVMEDKQLEVDKMIKKLGEDAVYETGVTGIPPEIVKILGRLYFRTSYGQNVLKHSIECSFIAESIANIIGANVELAKKAALLHDLGKTVSHEIGGKHAILSGEIARKFDLDEDLIHAIEAHHEDIPLQSVEAYIVQAADAISASRPGARRETSEKFIKRMVELEGIATSYKGVNKCFAMSSGRELWIFVNPKDLSDLKAERLSSEITRRIEKNVKYPGEVRVVMIRENRYINIAK
jgi:ribonuclease Y